MHDPLYVRPRRARTSSSKDRQDSELSRSAARSGAYRDTKAPIVELGTGATGYVWPPISGPSGSPTRTRRSGSAISTGVVGSLLQSPAAAVQGRKLTPPPSPMMSQGEGSGAPGVNSGGIESRAARRDTRFSNLSDGLRPASLDRYRDSPQCRDSSVLARGSLRPGNEESEESPLKESLARHADVSALARASDQVCAS